MRERNINSTKLIQQRHSLSFEHTTDISVTAIISVTKILVSNYHSLPKRTKFSWLPVISSGAEWEIANLGTVVTENNYSNNG